MIHAAWSQYYYEANIIMVVGYLGKDEQMGELDRIENTEIDTYTYGLLIFDRDIKDFQWGKKNLFNK